MIRRTMAVVGAVVLAGCTEATAPVVLAPTQVPVVASSTPAPSFLPHFERGMGVLVYGTPDPNWGKLFARLAQDGVNSVVLTFGFRQPTPQANRVEAEQATPSVETLRVVIRNASDHGMTVTLRPLMDQSNMTGSMWRGAVWPANPAQWFRSYTAFLDPYFDLSQAESVHAFILGSELNGLEHNVGQWEALIQHVRGRYKGKLGLAYNWDYFPPSVVHPLSADFFAVDAYFPLSTVANPTTADLVAAWQSWIAAMRIAAEGKPIIIAEIGASAQAGSWQKPWKEGHGYDPGAQELYYAAACEALRPVATGIYWWYTDVFSPHSADLSGFDPLGKPAEKALVNCYGQKGG